MAAKKREGEEREEGPKKAAKKSKAIARDATPRREASGGRRVRILSVNVNGLRAALDPAKGADRLAALVSLVRTEEPDILCLNEHKLNPGDVEAAEAKLLEALDGAFETTRFACSTAKKGYSGVAMLVRPTVHGTFREVRAFPEAAEADAIVADEGRIVAFELDSFVLVATYVPNSGQTLERLDYRVETWDRGFSRYLAALDKPVVVVGDLNVAFSARDIHNMYDRPNFPDLCDSTDFDAHYVGLQQLKKQPGLTPRERASFAALLADAALVDTFRAFHPDANGVFSYFSQRAAQNRPNNRGLRLDYVLASADMLPGRDDPAKPTLADSFVLDAAPKIADHCPVGCDILLPS